MQTGLKTTWQRLRTPMRQEDRVIRGGAERVMRGTATRRRAVAGLLMGAKDSTGWWPRAPVITASMTHPVRPPAAVLATGVRCTPCRRRKAWRQITSAARGGGTAGSTQMRTRMMVEAVVWRAPPQHRAARPSEWLLWAGMPRLWRHRQVRTTCPRPLPLMCRYGYRTPEGCAADPSHRIGEAEGTMPCYWLQLSRECMVHYC